MAEPADPDERLAPWDGAVERLRTVVLLGGPDAGTSLLAARLYAGAGPAAAVPAPEGRDSQGRLELRMLEHRGHRVHLLDAPGEPELVAARVAGMRGADAALLCVPADRPVDPRTVALWQVCRRDDLACTVVLTCIARPAADTDDALALCRRLLDEPELHLLHVPVHEQDGRVAGLLDLLALELVVGTERRPAEPEHRDLVAGVRDDLLEAVLLDSDDALFEAYVSGALAGTEPQVAAALQRAVRHDGGGFVLAVDAETGIGVPELLDHLLRLPGPTDREAPAARRPDGEPREPLVADPAGPLVAEVLRGGDPALVRVWSGRTAGGGGAGEALEIDGAPPTGAVLAAPPVLLEPWQLPEPFHPARLVGGADLTGALERLVALDPTVRVETGEPDGPLLWTLGPAHLARCLLSLPAVPEPLPTGSGQRYEVALVVQAVLARRLSTALGRELSAATSPGPPDEDGRAEVTVELALHELPELSAVVDAALGAGGVLLGSRCRLAGA